MRKLILPFILLLFIFNCSSDDPTIVEIEVPEIVINDDVILSTQAEVNSFGTQNVTRIRGSLTIGINEFTETPPDITDLSPLNTLQIVNNDLIIVNTQLQTLEGLESLTTINNDFTISGNRQLRSLFGLEGLTTINNEFRISGNNELQNLDGLENLEFAEAIDIRGNRVLTSIDGLSGIKEVNGDLRLESLPLTNLGLNNLKSVNRTITLRNLPLGDIDGFNSLINIEGLLIIDDNNNLTSIKGFQNLETINGLSIASNDVLTSLKELNFITNITDFGSGLQFFENESLTSLEGLENIKSLQILNLFNSAFRSLQGLEGLENLSALNINGNSNLTSLQGLENLNEISQTLILRNNPSLISLNGLNTLMNIPQEIAFENFPVGIIATNNSSLNDLCAVQTAVQNNPGIEIEILENLFNPSVQDIIDGNCSL